MRPYQIFYAKLTWRGCEDERPWLIIDQRPGDRFGCFPISGQSYSGDAFFIDAAHPDFPATGLTKSCYVHYQSIIELRAEHFRRYKGEMTGEMLRAFLREAGF